MDSSATSRTTNPALQKGVQTRAPQIDAHLLVDTLNAVFLHAHDAIFTTDLNERVLSWNPAAERVYGYTANEIIGRDVAIILPQDRKDERRSLLQRIACGENPPLYETKRVRKGGSIIDLSLTISPLRDANGQLIGLSTISRDISERVALQRALQEKQRELEDFFENAVVGLHWVGPDGRIIWANRAEMESLGYTREEYIGRHIADFHADSEVICDILSRLGRNQELHGYEARLRCKDGTIKHVLISSSVLRDEAGRFIHTRCFTVDVTARMRAEEALRRTEKMAAIGRLAASMAHEINNPLEAVMNLLFLAQENATREEVKSFLQAADSELRRVAYIARRTLGFFKDNTENQFFALDAVAADVISIYRSLIEGRSLNIIRDFRPVSVRGNEGELRQVISNLILNAVEASRQGGTITVRVRKHRGVASCLVADHGDGIEPGNRQRIFEPFFTTKKDTGTGLGLWTSNELVRKHDGRIRFRTSTRIGVSGTMFRITLPAAVV